jgi:CysZ protein
VLWPIFAITSLVLVFYTFALVANLIAAPFNGLLAEAVEKHLTGQSLDDVGGWKAAMKDLWPSIKSELVKLSYFIIRAIPLLILLIIPGINIIATFLWMLFSAWMLTIEYMDYPMANHKLMFPEQRQRLKARRLLGLGFGASVTLLTMIPVVNFIAMPAAVAGATSAWVRDLKETS